MFYLPYYPSVVPQFSLQPTQPRPSKIKVSLHNHDLWNKFHDYDTEMIITKSGRHMFPKVEFNITGLEPTEEYFIILELRLASDKRHKFLINPKTDEGYWVEYSRADHEAYCFNRYFVYSHSPIEGSELTDKVINFKSLKLTNNPDLAHTSIVLQSMHKYIPRLWVLKFNRQYFVQNGIRPNIYDLFCICEKEFFEFSITEFIAVTAYQNKKITKIKVDNNPFAKGFRDSDSAPKRKRKNDTDTENESDDGRRPEKRMRKQIAPLRMQSPIRMNQFRESAFRPWPLAGHPSSSEEAQALALNYEYNAALAQLSWQYQQDFIKQLTT